MARKHARRSVRLGLIQFHADVGEVSANLDRVERLIRKAASARAQLVSLPELWSTGYLAGTQFPDLAEPLDGPTISHLRKVARELGIFLCGGSIAEASQTDKPYNTAVLLSPSGAILARHRKVHLFADYERAFFTAGSAFSVVSTPPGRISLAICYDGDFPEVPRLVALQGAELLLHPSAYPEPWQFDWRTLYPAHALENTLFIASLNLVGREPGRFARAFYPRGVRFFGETRLIGPDGRRIAQAPYARGRSCVLLAEADLSRVAALRADTEANLRWRRPEVYGWRGGSKRPGGVRGMTH